MWVVMLRSEEKCIASVWKRAFRQALNVMEVTITCLEFINPKHEREYKLCFDWLCIFSSLLSFNTTGCILWSNGYKSSCFHAGCCSNDVFVFLVPTRTVKSVLNGTWPWRKLVRVRHSLTFLVVCESEKYRFLPWLSHFELFDSFLSGVLVASFVFLTSSASTGG
jgi:hypothetical protein